MRGSSQGGHELAVVGQADAVGVESDALDPLVVGEGDEVEDLGVDGGLPAGEHHHLGTALGPDEGVEAGLHLLEGQGEAVRLVAGGGAAR